jgi:hypothetical protein
MSTIEAEAQQPIGRCPSGLTRTLEPPTDTHYALTHEHQLESTIMPRRSIPQQTPVTPFITDVNAPAHRFPVEVLPTPLARFVSEVVASLPCPPDFIGVPMLALLGCAVGTTRVLRVKPGWLEGPRLYMAVVADTGTKKSPALRFAAQPVYDRQRWLSFWNGAPVLVNRKSRKQPIVLENPLVCVAGCLPPDVLGELSDERGREDGFIHRILFGYPDPMPVHWTDAAVSTQAMQGYAAVYEALWDLQGDVSRAGAGPPPPMALEFTTQGRAAFIMFANALYEELADPALPDHLRGPWAKLDGYGARVALILHLCRVVCAEADKLVRDLMDLGYGYVEERQLPSGRTQRVFVLQTNELS